METITEPNQTVAERTRKRKIGAAYLSIALVLVVAYLCVSPFNISDADNSWLHADSGILTENGLRILNGEALYVNVWSMYGPAADHSVALVFRLLGANLRSLRIILALAGAATAFLAFLLTRKISSARYAAAVALLAFLMGPVCLNFPYPNWFCIPLGLSMVFLEHEGWKRDNNLLRLLAGGVAGLIFLFKANWGIFAFAALLNIQCIGGLSAPKNSVRSSATETMKFAVVVAILCSLPVMSLILLKDHLAPTNILIFFLPTCSVLAVGISLRERSLKAGTSVQIFPPLVCSLFGFATLALPVTFYYFHQLGPDAFHDSLVYPARVFSTIAYFPFPPLSSPVALTLVFLFVFQGILMLLPNRIPQPVKTAFLCVFWIFLIGVACHFIVFLKEHAFKPMAGHWSSLDWPFRLACYIPVSVHLGLTPVFMNDARTPDLPDRDRLCLSLSLWIYSMATFLVLYPVMDIYHLIWVFIPVLITGAYFLFRSLRYWEHGPERHFAPLWRRLFRMPAACLLPIFIGAFFAFPILKYFFVVTPSPLRIALAEFSDIQSSRAGILMPAEKAADMSNVVLFVSSHAARDESVFDMTGSYFNFLADRKTVTRRTNFFPGLLLPSDIEEIKRKLIMLKPKIVVTSIEAEKLFACYYPEIYGLVNTRYKPVCSYGPFSVRTLKEQFL